MALQWVLDGADLQQIICKRMSRRTLVLQRERGAVQKRKLQDAGDSEPLSNLLGRLEIQGGGKMTLQLCLQWGADTCRGGEV